ncbi:hypothetical protein OG528_23670 [Streptomyces platensis]|uniref:TRADD-N-associated membrane domain-containing protein n=1 Tax=Streptomyces platensis TaxID=58346 RepID=UPI0030E09E45
MSNIALAGDTLAILAPIFGLGLPALYYIFSALVKRESNKVEIEFGAALGAKKSPNVDSLLVEDIKVAEEAIDKIPASMPDVSVELNRLREDIVSTVADRQGEKQSMDEQTKLVLRYYAQGAGQAQVSFYWSLAFASLGFFVIIWGVVIAVNSPNDKTVQAAIVAGSGVVTDAVAALFFTVANRSRRLMLEFIDKLRHDREQDHKHQQAKDLIGVVDNINLRDALRALTVLNFVGSEVQAHALPGFPEGLNASPAGSHPSRA